MMRSGEKSCLNCRKRRVEDFNLDLGVNVCGEFVDWDDRGEFRDMLCSKAWFEVCKGEDHAPTRLFLLRQMWQYLRGKYDMFAEAFGGD